MNNLWRRMGNRKSSSKSTSEKNETQNKPREPEPEKNATQNKPQKPEPERKELVLLGNHSKRFDLEDLFRASVEVLGKGTVGTTYKAHLDDGTTVVVVKRLNHVVLSAEDFRDKVVALGAMDHKNLLPLRGYYDSKNVKILLYDFMTLGSLSDQLHGFREIPLSWQVRLSIALGAARAIEHLHSQDSHHGNIKSSNVLLTPSYEARVSDYGLPHLTRPASMAGVDPSKADVYDFGMLLLELLTGKLPTQTLLNVEGQSVDLPTWVESVVCESRPTWVEVFDVDPQDIEVAMFELLGLAARCVTSNSPMRPRMSEVRRMIEELCGPGEQWDWDSQPDDVYEETEYADSWLIGNTHAENALSWPIDNAQVDRGSPLNQFSEVNGDMYTRKPPDGVMEVYERVYVFEYCLTTDWSFFGQITTDWLKNDEYENYMRGIVARLQDQFPAAPFMVLNFGEQENQSQIAQVLFEYAIPVVEFPQNYGDCPIPRVEIIHNFLRSANEWLSSDTKQNMLLMHCERGAWPVLAFMLASLSLYRKKQDGEQKTLDMIYKKAPHQLLQLTSTLDPLPSQLRYLHYVSTQNADSDWPPPDQALVIKSVILSFIPHFDAEGGCCPIVKIIGRDPFVVADQNPTVLFSTPRRSEHVRHYKQADSETVKLDIHCNVQGDVVLECMSMDADLEHGESMFRAMFNTAFISDNVLKLEFDGMDVLWDRRDRYPKEFMAEIVFSQPDAATSFIMVDLSSDEEKNENQIESLTKIEPEELPAEGRAIHSIILSSDANTSPEENEVRELPVQSSTQSTSTLPPMPPLLSETSVLSAPEAFGSFELATESPYNSPSFELDQQYDTTVEGNDQSFSLFDLTGSLSSSSVQSQASLLASPPPPPPTPPCRSKGASSLNSIKKVPFDPLPQASSPNSLVSGTPPSSIMNNSPQTSSIPPPAFPSVGQVEQMMPSFEMSRDAITTQNIVEPPRMLALKQKPSSSLALPQVVISGENTESLKWKEGLAAVTGTNTEVTSVSDSASSSAVNSGNVEATAAAVSNSVQIPDVTLPKQEKLYLQDGSPSSTSMSSGYDYDIFLSFRGPDTRSGITDFLYTSLLAAGMCTFKDGEELRVGEEFGPKLLEAISHSKIAIPIFSKGYAFSKWCLNELVQMVECSRTRRQKVMPIFYDVTPAEVRHQAGSYGEAFLLHEKKFDENTISKWKAALKHVANLNGWDTNSMIIRREGELVKTIVRAVIDELKTAYLMVTGCLVGVENHVKEINKMMCGDSEDIKILGIHGMGGVGKTTLTKIIYNQFSHHFEHCCFLSNIRETSELKGIEHLQNQLMSNVLKRKWSSISNADEGIKTIKERLRDKKALVLLDDVDRRTHLNALVGNPAWFGLGSRIIITSRNRDIIAVPEICYAYELKGMNFNQSLQLFCKHAFGRNHPLDDHVAFSTEVVKSTGGLPLALEAIGSHLSGKSKDVWDVTLKKLKQVPHDEVKRKLKISYDALDDWQKHIFLDIACLFTGFDKRIVLHMWNDSNLFPEEGLEVLQKMSLIKIGEDNKLWVHDQLRDLSRDIVRQECNMELEKQTRLWNHEEALDVLMKKKTKKVEALCLKLDHQLQYYFANREFERLSNLKYLEVRAVQDNWPSNDFPDNLQNSTPMLSELRWLSCHHFPLELKLTNFSLMNIVILDLSWSKLSESWDGWSHIKMAENLKVLNLTGCVHLHTTPDFSTNVKLQHLILENCGKLAQIDKSIRHLKQLVILNLRFCLKLRKLPEEMNNLESLKELLLDGTSVREIPEWKGMKKLETLSACECPSLKNCRSIGNLTSLLTLSLEHASISQIPQEIGVLQKLEHLSLRKCKLLRGLPDSIGKLESLLKLNLSHTHIVELPNSFGNLKNLKVLRMSGSSIRILPGTIVMLEKLEEINAEFCQRLEGAIPHGIESLSNLRILKLTNTIICQVPRLPESLIGLHISTHSMKTLPDLSNLVNLIDLDLDTGEVPLAGEDSVFAGSSQLVQHPLPWYIGKFCNLESLKLSGEIIFAIHRDICLLSQLKKLELVCSNLQFLPRLPSSLTCLVIKPSQSLETLIDLSNLKELSELRIDSSAIIGVQGLEGLENLEILDLKALHTLEELPDLSNLKKLGELHLGHCHNLIDVQSIEDLRNLKTLKLIEIPLLERLPNLSNLKNLNELQLWYCHGLTEIESLEGSENLMMLELGELPLLERLPNLSNLKKLTKLDVQQCHNLVKIRGRLESLEELHLEGCRSLDEVLDPASSFKKLKSL